jgi:hypothetical protein
MKTLHISDIHHRTWWIEKLISRENPDLTIFHGDYFDNFGDSLEDCKTTAIWLKESLSKEKRIHLLGNHDQAYRWPNNPWCLCSGFNFQKAEVINNIITKMDWEKIKLLYIIDNWIFSHAGLNRHLFEHPINGIYESYIKSLCDDAVNYANMSLGHPVLLCGQTRGGREMYGGITWQDQREFTPLKGWNQIVGHTPQRNGQPTAYNIKDKDRNIISRNLFLDTHSQHYAILENNNLTIHENDFIKNKDAII